MRGIVHVGANLGQEIPAYVRDRRTPILAFEPLPDVYAEACRLYANEIKLGEVTLVNIALNETHGHVQMFVAQNADGSWDTPTASTLGGVLPAAAKKMGWDGWLKPYEHKLVEVEGWRFDDWIDMSLHCRIEDYIDLVIDVQGMELAVLKGFERHLSQFKNLVVECSEVPIYQGGASANDVSHWLAERDFLQTSPIHPHGDITFIRMGD